MLAGNLFNSGIVNLVNNYLNIRGINNVNKNIFELIIIIIVLKQLYCQ